MFYRVLFVARDDEIDGKRCTEMKCDFRCVEEMRSVVFWTMSEIVENSSKSKIVS